MVSFNWLHLTDLHLGIDGMKDLWPNVEEEFFKDLGFLLNKAGSLDLVLFTGDLVQYGKSDEFKQVDLLLQEFWEWFKGKGFEPKLLAVPGNHDLVRPNNLEDPALINLMYAWDKSEVQKPFWDKADSAQRKVVSEAFTNYDNWWKNTAIPKPADYSDGMLPGDFSASVKKDGINLGILGLNSAFLQLKKGDLKGKLAMHVRQFHKACGGNGPRWTKKHDVCFLLTHHPVDWMTKEAQEHFNDEIHSPPERFALHLFGHMHEANLASLAEGGSYDRSRLQSCSLFGLKKWGEDDKKKRRHGYTLGQLRIDGPSPNLCIWPRMAIPKTVGGREFERDTVNFRLTKGKESTIPKSVTLLRGHDYVVNRHIVKKHESIKRKRWRSLESVFYPVPQDNTTYRDNFIKVLSIALHNTFTKKDYIEFTSIFRVSKQVRQGYEIIAYNLLSHQPEFAENVRRESSKHYQDAFNVSDRKQLEELNQKERVRWAEYFSDWRLDLFLVPFSDSWGAINLLYDPASKHIRIQPPKQDSTRIEDYEENIETTSELFQFIAAISRLSIAYLGDLVWLFGNYPLMKLITDIVDNKEVRPDRIRINASDYEEWDYTNKQYDKEVREYDIRRKKKQVISRT